MWLKGVLGRRKSTCQEVCLNCCRARQSDRSHWRSISGVLACQYHLYDKSCASVKWYVSWSSRLADLPPGLVYWHLQCNNSKWNVSPSELNPFSSCIPRPWNDKVLVTDNSLAPRPSDLTSHKVASISSPVQWDSVTALHLPVACRSKPPSSFMWTASTASSLSLPSPLVEGSQTFSPEHLQWFPVWLLLPLELRWDGWRGLLYSVLYLPIREAWLLCFTDHPALS